MLAFSFGQSQIKNNPQSHRASAKMAPSFFWDRTLFFLVKKEKGLGAAAI